MSDSTAYEEWMEILNQFSIKDLARIYVASVEKHLPEIELFFSHGWEGDAGVKSLDEACLIYSEDFGDLISHIGSAGITEPVAFIQAHRKMIIADHLCSASFRQVGGIYEKDVPLEFVRGWASSQGLYYLIKLWVRGLEPEDHDDGHDLAERRLIRQLEKAFPPSFNYDRPSLYEVVDGLGVCGTMAWKDMDGDMYPATGFGYDIANAINPLEA